MSRPSPTLQRQSPPVPSSVVHSPEGLSCVHVQDLHPVQLIWTMTPDPHFFVPETSLQNCCIVVELAHRYARHVVVPGTYMRMQFPSHGSSVTHSAFRNLYVPHATPVHTQMPPTTSGTPIRRERNVLRKFIAVLLFERGHAPIGKYPRMWMQANRLLRRRFRITSARRVPRDRNDEVVLPACSRRQSRRRRR
jgi:hypothetical protein